VGEKVLLKLQPDKHCTDREFQVGEKVLLKLQPYAQTTVVNRKCPKLAFKFFGPYTVLELIGHATYRLKLPAGSMIHPVFHMSQLKPFTVDFTPVFSKLPTLVDLSQGELQPESIVDRRLVKKGSTVIPQVHIKWIGLPTWEDWYVLIHMFPSVASWDQGGSPTA
jgi:hypothetical protein